MKFREVAWVSLCVFIATNPLHAQSAAPLTTAERLERLAATFEPKRIGFKGIFLGSRLAPPDDGSWSCVNGWEFSKQLAGTHPERSELKALQQNIAVVEDVRARYPAETQGLQGRVDAMSKAMTKCRGQTTLFERQVVVDVFGVGAAAPIITELDVLIPKADLPMMVSAVTERLGASPEVKDATVPREALEQELRKNAEASMAAIEQGLPPMVRNDPKVIEELRRHRAAQELLIHQEMAKVPARGMTYAMGAWQSVPGVQAAYSAAHERGAECAECILFSFRLTEGVELTAALGTEFWSGMNAELKSVASAIEKTRRSDF
jgi:hypothetical protein